ncbi:hypothetical protein GOODEAATRI_018572 [Goodea atripinnis]|uniref:DDHD domain-containing protein n=1 Tax=Goodea atripinnis TaxID=208336 RepID=A0ABV0PZ38_9TELE
MTASALRCTGRRSPQRSDAAPGSTKAIRTVVLFRTQRISAKSWRFVKRHGRLVINQNTSENYTESKTVGTSKELVQFQPSSMPDEWGTTQDGQTRPRVVKRGIDDDHDEVPDVDHLVFMVHGIGPVCDLRFRSMIECGSRWMNTPSAEWSSFPSSGTRLYMEMPRGWTGVLAVTEPAQQKKAEVKEDSQAAVPQPAPGDPTGTTMMKPPVGSTVSSVHYNCFEVGTGQVSVIYHSLDFEPVNFFALGSPIGMFLTVRGLEKIDEMYQLPTCKRFFNIYHPNGLGPEAGFHQLPEERLADAQRVRSGSHLIRPAGRAGHGGQSDRRGGEACARGYACGFYWSLKSLQFCVRVTALLLFVTEDKIPESPEPQREEQPEVKIGMLNGGNRIDYVLQEKPIESFNEYLFALQSHLCYWYVKASVYWFSCTLQIELNTLDVQGSRKNLENNILNIN